MIREMTKGRRYGLVNPLLELLDDGRDAVVDLQHEPCPPLALPNRLRQRLVEELVNPTQHGSIDGAAQARARLVRLAEREK